LTQRIHASVLWSLLSGDELDLFRHQQTDPEIAVYGHDIDGLKAGQVEAVATACRERQLKPLVHAPFFDLNLGARDPRVAALTVERVMWSLDAAVVLGSPQVVVHPGYTFLDLSDGLDGWLVRAGDNLKHLAREADQRKLRLVFENIWDKEPATLLALAAKAGDPDNLGFCFDAGHFNLFSEVPMRSWLQALGNRIWEVHLHDNYGETDDHIAVGDGTLKYEPLTEWLHKVTVPITLTLEMPIRTHIIKSMPIIRRWLAPPPVE
jgi:sugar phosphate isomerase/epimerase